MAGAAFSIPGLAHHPERAPLFRPHRLPDAIPNRELPPMAGMVAAWGLVIWHWQPYPIPRETFGP